MIPVTPLRAVAVLAVLMCARAQQPPPQIKSGIELLAVDVQVVDREGYPFTRLRPDDFTVTVDGKRRRVVSVEMVQHAGAETRVLGGEPRTPPPGGAPATAPSGRIFILAVDEHSFTADAVQAAMSAAARFIDQLRPDDLVGLYAYPTAHSAFDATTDHEAVKRQLGSVMGLLETPMSEFNLAPSEVIDITAGDGDALARVVARECPPTDRQCPKRVASDAQAVANFFEMSATQSLGGLRGMLRAVAAQPGRKTIVIVSGGLVMSDRPGGRPDIRTESVVVGLDAGSANANVYVLHIDSTFLDAFSARGRRGKVVPSLMQDAAVTGRGLEMLAGAAGGTLLRVEAGTADRALARVLRETTAHYVLGVEVAASDHDGKPHPIRVQVGDKGAVVRSRAAVVIPRIGDGP